MEPIKSQLSQKLFQKKCFQFSNKNISLNFQFHSTNIFLESSVLFYHEIPFISIYLILVTNIENKFHDILLIFIY